MAKPYIVFAIATINFTLAKPVASVVCQLATVTQLRLRSPHQSLLDMTDIDTLEMDFGQAILSALTGQSLTRDRQPVRLFDQTKHSSEYYFRRDEQGKPYIQNFAEGKRYYPLTAYCLLHQVDYPTAVAELSQQYSLNDQRRPVLSRPRLGPTTDLLPAAAVDELPLAVYERSRVQPERNGFYQYLCSFFDQSRAAVLVDRYRLGTSRHWQYEGALATCLPQFDTMGKLRQVKVIPFHPVTGRRAKAHQDARRWNERKKQYEPDEGEKVWFAGRTLAGNQALNLQQCYFGEHLLSLDPDQPVALVEGESTAVVCSAIWPSYCWLATGGSTGGRWYDPQRFAVFTGRTVVLWPDSQKYADWQQKAESLQGIAANLSVSRYIEDHAPPGADNLDLRDLLTWPRYTPKTGKPMYGQLLAVEELGGYPADWDSPVTGKPPVLVESPNRAALAERLGLPVDELPLYQLHQP